MKLSKLKGNFWRRDEQNSQKNFNILQEISCEFSKNGRKSVQKWIFTKVWKLTKVQGKHKIPKLKSNNVSTKT